MIPDDPFRRRRAIEMQTLRESRVSPHVPMGEGAEFNTIRQMIERWGPHARGIGDDAAIITSPGDRTVLVSTDTSVENVHFRRAWLNPEEIGYRAAAAALSDLAAMGATPLGILVAITVPESWRADLDRITDGIGEAAAIAEAIILGGDTTSGTELVLTLTVIGTTRQVLHRKNACTGDRLYVTGRLGGPLAALRELQAGRHPNPVHRNRFARPVARIKEAMWLSEHGASAAIDISDCLAAELGHLAAASRRQLNVRLEDIPAMAGISATDALTSGEEYELLVASPVDIDTNEFRNAFGLELTRIGAVTEGEGVVLTDSAQPVALPAGYLHFAE